MTDVKKERQKLPQTEKDGDSISVTVRRIKGDAGCCKKIAVGLRNDLLSQLDEIAAETNRSRNELINLLLENALPRVRICGEVIEYEPIYVD